MLLKLATDLDTELRIKQFQDRNGDSKLNFKLQNKNNPQDDIEVDKYTMDDDEP